MLPLDEYCSLGPAMDPITFDCGGRSIEELGLLVHEAKKLIGDRLRNAGFLQETKMLLIVPEAISDLPIDLPVACTKYLGEIALLLTLSVGGHKIISSPDDMTYEQWLCAVMRGKRPNLIITMPWAQARFLNWGKALS